MDSEPVKINFNEALVLRLIETGIQPLSAAEIHSAIIRAGIKSALSTVHRNMGDLVRKGFIVTPPVRKTREAVFSQGVAVKLYELTVEGEDKIAKIRTAINNVFSE